MPNQELTNEELIQRFEADAVPDNVFHHADHVRLAFAYLSQYPVLQALERFATALKRFAAARGKPQLYHETITCAYLFLIRERMARCAGVRSSDIGCESMEWKDFVRHNADLLVWKDGILTRYYQPATLQSDLARTVFILPDKACAGL